MFLGKYLISPEAFWLTPLNIDFVHIKHPSIHGQVKKCPVNWRRRLSTCYGNLSQIFPQDNLLEAKSRNHKSCNRMSCLQVRFNYFIIYVLVCVLNILSFNCWTAKHIVPKIEVIWRSTNSLLHVESLKLSQTYYYICPIRVEL